SDTYTVTVVVTDSVGAQDTGTMTIQVNPPIIVTGGSNETTTYGIARSTQAFSSSGGTLLGIGISGNYLYSFTSTPGHDGISIDPATGVITVSETVTAGTYSIVVKSTDILGLFGTKTITFIVNDSITVGGGQAQLITTFGTARSSAAFTYQGGTVPLTFTVSGTIPGVTIDQSGVVRVSETTPIGTYTETVTVTDFVTAFGFVTLTIIVNETLSISGGSDSVVTTFGRAATSAPFLTDSGTVPRLLSFSATALGLTLDTNTGIVYVGANTPANTYYETVTVTDEAGATALKTITIIVNPAVTVTGGSNITTTITRPDTSSAFTASGGTTELSGGNPGDTLTFSLGTVTDSSGATVDPATLGIALSSDGIITVSDQTPADTYTVQVVSTDGLNETGSATMIIVVNPMIDVVGGNTISANYETASTHAFTFINGTGIKTATVSGSTVSGTSWSLSDNQAIFSIGLYTTPQSFTETLTITDAKGASIVHVITATIAKGARSISITSSAATVKYGDTLLISSDWVPTLSNNGDTLIINTSTGAICSVAMRDTNTAILTADGGVGTCTLGAQVIEGVNYVSAVADSISVTVTQADALVVTVNAISSVTYNGSPAAITPSITVTGFKFSDAVDTVTYTYASTSGTCAQGGTCVVGDIGPGGGKIFYVASSPEWWGQYLEAAPSDLTSNSWCASGFGSSSTFRGTSSAIGDGKLNSVITASNCSGGALGDSRNNASGGRSDWYLPSSGELAQMYAQRTLLGLDGIATYWSSNPVETTLAVAFDMSAGTTSNASRAMTYAIRPIRAFGPTSSSYSANTQVPTEAGAYTVTPSALALAAGRSLSNYASVSYVAGSLVINKALQSAISIASQNGARTGVDETYTLYPTGGSSSASNAYRVISGGTAGGCAATTYLSATVEGTCWVTVYRAGDNNYQAVIGTTIEVGFLKFESSTSGTVQIVDTATKPVIYSLSASSGLEGDTVTITGGALTGTMLMVVGRVKVNVFTVVNSTRIDFRVPAGALNGKVGVRNAKGEIAYSANNFISLTAPTLTITDSTLVGRAGQQFTDQLVFTATGSVDTYSVSLDPLPTGLV
ncbi:MAG: beta strand repeat-containing protein, partial [Candidatus Nanopelagicaceae bacterium]